MAQTTKSKNLTDMTDDEFFAALTQIEKQMRVVERNFYSPTADETYPAEQLQAFRDKTNSILETVERVRRESSQRRGAQKRIPK